MNEHTPGPWNTTMYDGRVFVEPHGRTGMGEYICEVGLPSGERVHEDARLIAAAPDLLAACEAAYAWLGRFGVHAPTAFGGEAELAEQLRAAIANAKREP